MYVCMYVCMLIHTRRSIVTLPYTHMTLFKQHVRWTQTHIS